MAEQPEAQDAEIETPEATRDEELGPLTRRHRLTQVATVLGRRGLGFLLTRFGLEGPAPFRVALLALGATADRAGRPVQLRLALEELGATAIKLGQILSTRGDLLPPAYIDELAKLRDRVPPVDAAAIRGVIEREFGQPVEAVFARFDDAPLAAASIGQVHAAALRDGEEVVVKVQRPGVGEQIETDLRLLLDLARTAQRRSPITRDYDLVALAEEFAWTLRGELDYEREGRNADAFRRQFAGDPDIVIPTIHWPQTTARVLTMQRLAGVYIDDLAGLDQLDVDRHQLAVRSAEILLAEVFEHGFYHADPHPGNFLVQPDGAIGALDFGMVGRIAVGARLDLLDLAAAVVERDAARAVDAIEALGVAGVEASRDGLVRDVGRLLDRHVGQSLGELRVAEVTAELFAVVRRHRLRMPTELALLLKTLAMSEGVGRHLDPDFNAAAVAAPAIRRAIRRQLHPRTWEPELRRGVADLARAGLALPGALRRLTLQVDRGELSMTIRLRELDQLLGRLEAMVNRLAMSVLVAGFVVAAALLLSGDRPASAWVGWLVGIGLVAAAALGVWIVLSIRRGRR